MPPKQKKSSLADVLHEMRTKQKRKIGALAEFDMVPAGLTTGNLLLDAATGIGGLPMGRVTELFGLPSSGKTTTALQAAARLQQAGGTIVYLDFERTLDEAYVQALGVDTKDQSFIYDQPKSFEDGANTFRRLLATGEVGMVIHDSVARMVTEKEQQAETGKANVADRAKMMHQYIRQIVTPLHESNCAAVFLNHINEVIDATPMGQRMAAQGIKRTTTPGGRALPFYSSLRMEFKQVGNIRSSVVSALSGQKEDQIRQFKVQATVVKNKVGDPFGQVEVRVRFGKGFSNEYSILKVLRDHAAIKVDTTGKYTFPPELARAVEPNWLKGEDTVLRTMELETGWTARLEQYAAGLLRETGVEKVELKGLDDDGVPVDEAEVMSVLESDSFDETSGEML